MSDFTKDDLLHLIKCVRIFAMEYGDCAELDALQVKIKGMIDNYCEHQWLKRDKGLLCEECAVWEPFKWG